jgi:hypothetical protein
MRQDGVRSSKDPFDRSLTHTLGLPRPMGARDLSTAEDMTVSRDQPLLGIYLNDHLAGSVIGSNLARRLCARNSSGGENS